MFSCEMKILTLTTPKAKAGKVNRFADCTPTTKNPSASKLKSVSGCKGQETQKQNIGSGGNIGVQKSQTKSGQKANKGNNKKSQQQTSKNTNNNNNLVKNQNIVDEIMQLTSLQTLNANNTVNTQNMPQMLHTPELQHTIPDTVITHNNKDTSAGTPNTPLSSCNTENNDLSQSLLSRNRNSHHHQQCEPSSMVANPVVGGAVKSSGNNFKEPATTQSQPTGSENKKVSSSDTSYWDNNARAEQPSTSNTAKSNYNGFRGTDGQDSAGHVRNSKRHRNWKHNRHYSSTEDRKNYERNYERNDAPKTNYTQSRQNSANYEALRQNPLNYDSTKQASGESSKQATHNNGAPNNACFKQPGSDTPKHNSNNAFNTPLKLNAFGMSPKSNAIATSSKATDAALRMNAFGTSPKANPTVHFDSKQGIATYDSSKLGNSPNFGGPSHLSKNRSDASSKPHHDTGSTRNISRFDNQGRSGGNHEMSKHGVANYESNRQNNNRFDSSRQHSNNLDNSRRSSVSYNNGSTNHTLFNKSETRCNSAECQKKNLVCPHMCNQHKVYETPTNSSHHNNRFNRRSQFYRNNNHYNYISQIRRDRQNSYGYQHESKGNISNGSGNNQGRYHNAFRNYNNNKFVNCGVEYNRRNNQFNRFEQEDGRKRVDPSSKPETKQVDLDNSNINAFTGKPRTSSLSTDAVQKETIMSPSVDAVKPTKAKDSTTLPATTEAVTKPPQNPFLQSICSAQRLEKVSLLPLPSRVDIFCPKPALPDIKQPAQTSQSAQKLEPKQTIQPAQTLQVPDTLPISTEPTKQASQVFQLLSAPPPTPVAPPHSPLEASKPNQLAGPLAHSSLLHASSINCIKSQKSTRPMPPRIQRNDRGYSLEFLHQLGLTLANNSGLVRPFPFQDTEMTLSSPVRNIYNAEFVAPTSFTYYVRDQQQAGMHYNETNSNANGNTGRNYQNHQYQGNNRFQNYYPHHSYPMQNYGNYNGAAFTQGFNENLRLLPNQMVTASGQRSPSFGYYGAAAGGVNGGGGNKYQGHGGSYGHQKFSAVHNPHSNYVNSKKYQQHNQISSSASECSSSPRASISPGSYRQSIAKSRSNQSLAIDAVPKYSNRSTHRMNYNQQQQSHHTQFNVAHNAHYQTNNNFHTYQQRAASSTPIPGDNQNYSHLSYGNNNSNTVMTQSKSRSNSPSQLSLAPSIGSNVSSVATTYIQNQQQFQQCYRQDNYGNNRKKHSKQPNIARANLVSPFSIGNQTGSNFWLDKSTTATVADFVDNSSSLPAAFIAGNDMDSDSSSTHSFNRKSQANTSRSPVSRSSTTSSSSSPSLQSKNQNDTSLAVISKPLPNLSEVVDFKSYSLFILCHSQELSKHLTISARQQQSMHQQAAQQYVTFEQTNGQSSPVENNQDRSLDLWNATTSYNYYGQMIPMKSSSSSSDDSSPSLSPRHNNQQGDSLEIYQQRVPQPANIPLQMTTIMGIPAQQQHHQQLMQMAHLPESQLPNPYWLYLPYNPEKSRTPAITTQGDSVTCHMIASVPSNSKVVMPHPLETLMPCKVINHPKWDQLSQGIWAKFVEAQQTERTFLQKLHLWRFLNVSIKSQDVYPCYGLFIVGSTISGFGADSSDADMCLVSRMNPNADPRLEAIGNLVHLRDCLRKTKQFENFNLIEARVPILRFRDCEHGLEVDLNYNNAVGIRNTHLLYLYSQLDWRLRPLVLIAKQWAQFHDINNAKNMTISSYSLVLMMIHFLQCGAKPHVLPCLHTMYPAKFPLLRSNNDFGFVDMTEVADVFTSSNNQTLGELFLGFLEYYSLFRYHELAISVRTGGVIPIATCRQVKAQRNDIHQWKELCIEEPFDLTNTARSVYDYETFERVKWVFVSSWRMLSETLTLDALFTPVAEIPFLTSHLALQYQIESITGDEDTVTDTASSTSAYSSITNEELSQNTVDEAQSEKARPDDVTEMVTVTNACDMLSSHRSTVSVSSVATIEAITSDSAAILSAAPPHLSISTTVTTKDAAVEVTVKTSPQSDFHKSQNSSKTANPVVAAL